MLFNSENKAIEKNDVNFFEAGIIEDVKLERAELKTTPTGKRLIEVTFTKGGAKLVSSEWEPEKRETDTQEDYERQCSGFLSRLLDILGCFYPEDQLKVNVETFTELANWFISKVQMADKTKLVRVKAVYNKNGYVVLAGGYRYTFIEPMTIAKDNSKIRILAKDVIVRPEKEVDNIRDLKKESTTNSDNLPF